MRVLGPGHLLFATGLAGLGVLSLFSGDFAFAWQPVPAWVPAREILARVSGILLLTGGIGMLARSTATRSALVLAVYLLSWVLLLQAPRAAAAPTDVGAWLGVCENLVLMCGGWSLFALLAETENRLRPNFFTGSGGRRVARILFGVSCLVLGLSHFVYADATAGMVPAWLPNRQGFAYLTGAGHLAAGAGILLAVLPRLAATLEAVMISLFVVLLHAPAAAMEPTSRLQWTMLFVATALAGSVWSIARTYRSVPWGWRRNNEKAP
jgi:uncharacterized membrane protein